MRSSGTKSFLFELGTEELPAKAMVGMATALRDGLVAGFKDKALEHGEVHWYATPRRLAVTIDALSLAADDREVEVLGPPEGNSRDSEGNWTGAALGFAKKQGIPVDELEVVDTPKGARLGLRRTEPGARAVEVAADIISAAVSNIPVAKRMRWGRSRNEFLRPVQWLTAMLGDDVIDLSLFGLSAGGETRGHRFHHPEVIGLATASEYASTLESAKVLADFGKRRALIKSQVSDLAAAAGGTAVVGDDLLDEVTGLVEWPVALRGSFDEAFLAVPQEALISSMKEHQKYFHVIDADGALQPLFITIANIESVNPDEVVRGNERVIRPRLSDAAFFFETDKKTRLEDRGSRLKGVVFQNKLGTLADKTGRVTRLARWIAERLGADSDITTRASTLCKCDLVSDMVLEFPELQGIAGAHYARHDGEYERVAAAIEEHYWPKFAGDQLPASPEAAAVALADRLDTLVGIFGIGQTPTGSKDPFALRRASVAIIRILIDLESDLQLTELVDEAIACYPPDVLTGEGSTVVNYVLERLVAWYGEQGTGPEVLRAVTAVGVTAPAEIDSRVSALAQFATTDAAIALAAANKRVANILGKSPEEAADGATGVDPARLVEPAEKALFESLESGEATLGSTLEARDFAGALNQLAELREPIDQFFDDVMVNVEDSALRVNRLRLLATVRERFLRIADIAYLTTS